MDAPTALPRSAATSPQAGLCAHIAQARVALAHPVDGAFLGVFRIAIGLVLVISLVRFMALGWVDELLLQPRFLFTFWGFGFVRPLSSGPMHAFFVVLVGLAACFTTGLFFRPAAVLFSVGFAYLQLLDVTNYLNHYVLLGLLVAILAVSPAGRVLSLDARRDPARRLDEVPAWVLYALRVQVAAVYFHAGLAKLDVDWLLHAQPLSIWMAARWELPLIGPVLRLPFAPLAMSWAGFLFDCTVPLWLSFRRTRKLAYGVVLAFHAMTSALFPIGLFPVIMVVSALIFFPPEAYRCLVDRLGAARGPGSDEPSPEGLSRAALALFVVFVALQIVVPMRSWLYGGNVRWHEQGMRFAWKVMVREKNGSVTYRVVDPITGKEREVPPRKYLTARQERDFATQPDLILQLAHRIAQDHTREGVVPRVYVDATASLNGRVAARLIDPNIDLATVSDGVRRAAWILPAPSGPPRRILVPPR